MTAAVPVSVEAFAFDRSLAPVAEVEPGATVTFETSDTTLRRVAAGESLEEIGFERLNAVTGPVAVRGAAPGDALRVEILGVAVRSAWTAWIPGFGPLGGRTDGIRISELRLADGAVHLGDGVSVPVAPMIGCIGVAPAEGTGSTMRPLARTGGNMDLRAVSPGATVWLPVEVDGALLSLGDLHAAQGHGEPAFIALEAAGTATVRIDIEPGAAPPGPRVRDAAGRTVCVGLGTTYPEARASAVDQAFDVLVRDHGLSDGTAYGFLCAAVDLSPAGPSGSLVDGLEACLAVVPDPRALT